MGSSIFLAFFNIYTAQKAFFHSVFVGAVSLWEIDWRIYANILFKYSLTLYHSWKNWSTWVLLRSKLLYLTNTSKHASNINKLLGKFSISWLVQYVLDFAIFYFLSFAICTTIFFLSNSLYLIAVVSIKEILFKYSELWNLQLKPLQLRLGKD